MKEKVKVYKAVFEILHQSVRARFQEIAIGVGDKPEGKGAEYYGFGRFKDSDRITLMESMLNPLEGLDSHPRVNNILHDYLAQEAKHYKQISRKHLYNLGRLAAKLRDDYDILEIDIVFLHILSKYLKYQDFFAFLVEHISIDEQLARFQLKLLEASEDNLFDDELTTEYLGFFWSFITGGRKHVRVWINYYNKQNGTYPTQVIGLNADRDEGLDGVLHVGQAKADSSSYFYINLEEDNTKRPLVLMGYKGHVPLKDMKYIFCTASGIAKFGYPFSMELVMVKLNSEQKKKKDKEVIKELEGLNHIDFYLQFQRRNYRIPPRVISDLKTITARKNRSVNFQGLAGTYRMWSLGYQGEVIQYKFIIEQDFTASLYTPEENEQYAKQICVLSINTDHNKLCVSSHAKYGVSVINYAILDIDLGNGHQIQDGVYCGIGLAKGAKIVGERLLFFKDESEFAAKKLNADDLLKMLDENPDLKIPLNRLISPRKIKRRSDFLGRISALWDQLKSKF